MARAIAKSVRISPQKAGLLATALRGRTVTEALAILRFAPQASARPFFKVISSAAANAEHNEKLRADRLVVTELRADSGPSLKRWRPVSRGRMHPYRRPTAHLIAVVTEAPDADVETLTEAKQPTETPAAPRKRRKPAETPAAEAVLEAPTEPASDAPAETSNTKDKE